MRHFAVIGDPISHSRSPEVYAGIFAERGVEADCTRLLVKSCDLFDIANITAAYEGFAVTMPHKRSVMKYLDSVSLCALRCGAVNIVKNDKGCLSGYNTDGEGLVNALKSIGFVPERRRAAIYGRGGTALAAAYALHDCGAEVVLLVRTLPYSCADEPFERRLFCGYDDKVDLFINATPLGMRGGAEFDDYSFLSRMCPQFVFDMVYLNDGETQLIKTARAFGCGAADGHAMLYHQALLAADIWLSDD